MGRFIFAGIVTLILLLLLCSVTVHFDYSGGEFLLRVKYLFFTLYCLPSQKKPKKGGKRKKPKNKGGSPAEKPAADSAAAETKADETGKVSENISETAAAKPEKTAAESQKTEQENPKQKNKTSLSDLYEIARLVLDSLGKPLKKLLKRSVVDRLNLYIVCGGEDAAQAALNFGKTNILVGNALGWLGSIFTMKPPENLKVDVDFYSEETTAEASLRLRLSVLTALAFAFTLIGRAVRYYSKNPKAAAAVGILRK